MKKLYTSCLILSFLLLLIGCGASEDPTAEPIAPTSPPEPTPTSEPDMTATPAPTAEPTEEPTPEPTEAISALPDFTGYYELQSMYGEDDQTCLESNQLIDGAELEGAAFMQVCSALGTGQAWKITPSSVEEGYFTLQSLLGEENGTCLESNRVTNDAFLGGAAFMAECEDVTGQMWHIMPSPEEGYYILQSMFAEEDGTCLESNRVTDDAYLGGAAYMAPCELVTGQLWAFIPTSID